MHILSPPFDWISPLPKLLHAEGKQKSVNEAQYVTSRLNAGYATC
ncbi:MAG: hypothetical protein ABIH38_00945 [Patescibacteria group bacterium]